MKNKEILNKVVGSSSKQVLLFLERFLDSINSAYFLRKIYGMSYLVSNDNTTRISMSQTALSKVDVSCKIESTNGSYLSFTTKSNAYCVLNLNGCILVNNNLYKISIEENDMKRYIQIYKGVKDDEVNLYKKLSGDFISIPLDELFDFDDNSNNIGLTINNADLLGSLWSNPDEFVKFLTRQKVKKIN